MAGAHPPPAFSFTAAGVNAFSHQEFKLRSTCPSLNCYVDEGRRRGTCLSVDSYLGWGGAGFEPAQLDPRRRIGAGSTASASGGRGGDGDDDGGSRRRAAGCA
eukprot:1462295-Prymnesium_polylepis.1